MTGKVYDLLHLIWKTCRLKSSTMQKKYKQPYTSSLAQKYYYKKYLETGN